MSEQGRAQATLLSVFSTFNVGGAQVRFSSVANHFGPRICHHIFAMDDAYDCMTRLGRDVEVIPLRASHRKGDTLGNAARFRSQLKSLRPNLLVTHNWGTIEWGMANWPRLVRHVHIEDGFGPEEADRQIARRVWARRLALRGSTVVVPSRKLELIARDVWKLKPENIRYIPNGIDFDRFSDARVVPLDVRRDVPVIGTVAALRSEKNLFRLLEAFQLVRGERRCALIIVGDGAERPKLEARAAEMGLASDVVFAGYLADTERAYASLDVFALTSDTEQMPTSVLEAMAAGLPVVSTDVGDVRNMVSPSNTPFVVAREAPALARAIASLLAQPELSAKVGEANRAVALRDYTEAKMFAAYGGLFGVR